jgi:hypothetical protein
MEAEKERDARPLEKEPQQQSEISTPIAETPVENVRLHSQSHAHSSVSSSMATASSPTFSALAHSPASGLNDVRACFFFAFYIFVAHLDRDVIQPETRPTTASSTDVPSFHGLSYTITPSR